jgi:hypothetical protein
MNTTFGNLGFALATTVALSAFALAAPQAAQAFLITRTAGPLPEPGINAPLLPPTVIDFNSQPNQTSVPTSPTTIATSPDNGNATIQRTDGVAEFQGNQLVIGSAGNASALGGTVSFTFDDPRGLGYLGLNWQNPTANEVISFYSGNTLIQALDGSTVLGAALGNGRYFNFFVTNNGEIFNRVDLSELGGTPGNAFRVDNVAYQAIPTPALLPGIIALGVGTLRKRRTIATNDGQV